MPSRRRVDIVLDSIKRLQRIGATANLLNLLRKQHPADLAQVLGSLPPLERRSAFATLVDHASSQCTPSPSSTGTSQWRCSWTFWRNNWHGSFPKYRPTTRRR